MSPLVGAVNQLLIVARQQHAADPHTASKLFATTTSTGVLRRHLYETHLDVWVAGCDQLNINIKAKEAKPHVDEYRRRKQQTTGAAPTEEPGKKRTSFSKEAFVDAIVEFIAADDQVSFKRVIFNFV